MKQNQRSDDHDIEIKYLTFGISFLVPFRMNIKNNDNQFNLIIVHDALEHMANSSSSMNGDQ